jgi:hypothetical protein
MHCDSNFAPDSGGKSTSSNRFNRTTPMRSSILEALRQKVVDHYESDYWTAYEKYSSVLNNDKRDDDWYTAYHLLMQEIEKLDRQASHLFDQYVDQYDHQQLQMLQELESHCNSSRDEKVYFDFSIDNDNTVPPMTKSYDSLNTIDDDSLYDSSDGEEDNDKYHCDDNDHCQSFEIHPCNLYFDSNDAHKSVSSKYFSRTTPPEDTDNDSVSPSHPYTLDVDKNLTPLQYVKHFAKLHDSDFLDSIKLLERNNTSLMKLNEIVNQPGCSCQIYARSESRVPCEGT